jgi:hypothetical protein
MTRNIKPIRVEGNIAYVPLTKGYEAVIDAADVPLVGAHNWKAKVEPNTVYAVRNDRSGPKEREVRMHRVIMGEPNGLEVDHRDSNGLNNKRENLREATSQQNGHNTRISKSNTSGFKGVSWNKNCGKWRSYISINGQQNHLGFYDTAEQAHEAYCDASAKYHGEFGRTE